MQTKWPRSRTRPSRYEGVWPTRRPIFRHVRYGTNVERASTTEAQIRLLIQGHVRRIASHENGCLFRRSGVGASGGTPGVSVGDSIGLAVFSGTAVGARRERVGI